MAESVAILSFSKYIPGITLGRIGSTMALFSSTLKSVSNASATLESEDQAYQHQLLNCRYNEASGMPCPHPLLPAFELNKIPTPRQESQHSPVVVAIQLQAIKISVNG
jgi:hypothetical protein